ncbi:MAG: Hsp20 family protein [Burkholderiales bacterium]|nr:Hsp20 family protein [Burkholderiales bacterium]
MNGLPARRDAFSAFDEFFNDFFARAGVPVSPLAARASELPAAVRARMDVIDKGQKYEVLVDLPGVSKDDISVTVEGARVAIAAETKRQRTSEQDGKDGGRVLHTERYATSYARSFELPAEVTEDGAEAAFENGVLKLALPKRATVTSKRLTVR